MESRFTLALSARVACLAGLLLGGLASGQTLHPSENGDRSIPAGITAPVAADFNNDGLLDLLVHGETAIHVYLGKGDGSFLPPVSTPLNEPETRVLYHAATAGDFNGDRKVDLVAYGRYFQGNGDGSLKYVGPSVMEHHLETLQLYSGTDWGVAGNTASGTYGIASAENLNEILLGSQNAPYAAPWFAYSDINPYGIVATGGAPSTKVIDLPPSDLYCVPFVSGSTTNECVAVAHLGNLEGLGSPLKLVVFVSKSGPGNMHVALVGTGGVRTFHLKGGLGVFYINGHEEVQTRPASGVLNDVAYVDIDGGKLDLVTAQVNGATASVGYYSGVGAGFAPFMPLHTFPVAGPNVTLTVADWNKDGQLDLVTQDGASVHLYLGKPAVYAVSSATAQARIAPGSLASVYGRNLAPDTVAASALSVLPNTLGGVSVRINEGDSSYDADLLYVSPTQINFRVRPGSPRGLHRGQVLWAGGSLDFALSVDAEAPGLFTSDGAQAVASVSSSPSTWDVQLYATGLNGALASETSVLVDGQTLRPESVSGVPDVVGLDLVRVSIPKSSCVTDECLSPGIVLKVRESLSSGAVLKLNSHN